ncbi:MAG: hypothetical protein AAFN30_08355 [Actinomycetota bacterium]
MSRPRLRAWALALAGLLLLAACSVPTDERARAIDDAPAEVLEGTTTTVEEISEDEVEFVVKLFFYNEQNQLLVVDRPSDEQPLLDDVLLSLVANTPEEQDQYPGINTRLLATPPPLRVFELNTDEGVLTVLDEGNQYRGFETTNPERVQRVFSQVVCTMTEVRSDISAVRIIDGEGDIRVQSTQDGAVIEGPVSREAVNECKTAEQLAAEAAEEAEAADGEDQAPAEGDEGDG